MIKKEAIKQAKKIPENERKEKIVETLEATTKVFNEGSKDLEAALKDVDKGFYSLVGKAEAKDQQKALLIVQQAKAFIEKIKKGEDVHDIVKQIKNLQNGC